MPDFHELSPTDRPDLRRELAQRQLEAFVYNPGLDDMASLFGKNELPEAQSDRLRVLQNLATDHWDFRKGAERQAVD